jgi:molybdopterin molybdotransferase
VEPAAPDSVLLPDGLGLVLAEDIAADADSPPFDKALMDGYAVRSADFTSGSRELAVVAEVTAGRPTSLPVKGGEAIRLMTGAPLPEGADCVIPFERVRELEGSGRIVADAEAAGVNRNIARRGQSLRQGERVLASGTVLGPAQSGALAEMGRSTIQAIPMPTLAVLATGDELVPYDRTPGPGQIRNSNEIMLLAQARRGGARATGLGIARDDHDELKRLILQGLAADFLCMSGGVSAGTRDLVPSVLAEIGVQEVFHGCDVKPGKPIWFGQLPGGRSADGRPRWIFGLPGNPVSSMVCFELFVRTAIRRRSGVEPSRPVMVAGRLASAHVSRDSRPTYFPAILKPTPQGLEASPLNWQGSFDLQAMARANGLILFPSARTYEAGESIAVLPLVTVGTLAE